MHLAGATADLRAGGARAFAPSVGFAREKRGNSLIPGLRAVDHALEPLGKAVKRVLVASPKIRPWDVMESFRKLVDASGYAMAHLPRAKGFVDETHAQYIGTDWGSVSSPGCGEIVESSDAYVFADLVFSDYTTAGHNLLLSPHNLICVHPRYVKIADAIYNPMQIR